MSSDKWQHMFNKTCALSKGSYVGLYKRHRVRLQTSLYHLSMAFALMNVQLNDKPENKRSLNQPATKSGNVLMHQQYRSLIMAPKRRTVKFCQKKSDYGIRRNVFGNSNKWPTHDSVLLYKNRPCMHNTFVFVVYRLFVLSHHLPSELNHKRERLIQLSVKWSRLCNDEWRMSRGIFVDWSKKMFG